jgi:hypothetical protein
VCRAVVVLSLATSFLASVLILHAAPRRVICDQQPLERAAVQKDAAAPLALSTRIALRS